ncbi:magnesium transporter [Blattabacterium cuenoti]|uniref:magnesium transporter n=1 Tax=Blattabacterium cuenoti TaxID=1653831 RepID=UPI00163C67E4|nr:magnesium transporter [Blattabacterium cuenoti]
MKINLNDSKFINNQTISSLLKIIQSHPNDVVQILNLLELWKSLSIFKVLDFSIKKKIIKEISSFKKMEFINHLVIYDHVFLRNLPKDLLKDLIKYLNPEDNKRNTLISYLGYPKSSITRFMRPCYVSVQKTWNVQNVLDYIRKKVKNIDIIDIIYIIDEKGRLINDIKIQEFLLVDINTKIFHLIDHKNPPVYLNVKDTEKRAFKTFSIINNRRGSLPVIDDKNFLLGVVTISDILWILNENYKGNKKIKNPFSFKDYPLLNNNKSYLNVPLFRLIKKRAEWLVLLFIGEMLTTTVMQEFSSIIEKAVVIALFIPLVVSSGGNSGSQAASLIIQAMALGEVKIKDWWIVMKREIICGFFLGCILGLTGFIRVIAWHNINLFDYGPHCMLVGLTVFFSLIGVVLWGTFSGSMFPFIIKKFRGDPASSSAPFVATLVDVIGLIIYFSISYVLLHGILF